MGIGQVDVGIVGEHIARRGRDAGQHGIVAVVAGLDDMADVGVGHRDRRIVGAGDGERDGWVEAHVMFVGYGDVVGDRQLLAGGQEIESAVDSAVAEIDRAEAGAGAVVQGQRQRARRRQHAHLVPGKATAVGRSNPASQTPAWNCRPYACRSDRHRGTPASHRRCQERLNRLRSSARRSHATPFRRCRKRRRRLRRVVGAGDGDGDSAS